MDNPSEDKQQQRPETENQSEYIVDSDGVAPVHPMQLSQSHSGKILVVFFVLLLIGYAFLKFFVAPVAMQQAGVAGEQNQFDVPAEPVKADIPIVTQLFSISDESISATATWDEKGLCTEVVTTTSKTGEKQTHHACAKPNALETVWLIDAPNDADPSYVIVAIPHGFERLKIVLDDETQAEGVPAGKDIPAALAVFTVPPGKTLKSIDPINERGWSAGEAYCGKYVALKEVEGHTWGADQRLTAGGCVVPFDE